MQRPPALGHRDRPLYINLSPACLILPCTLSSSCRQLPLGHLSYLMMHAGRYA